MIEKFQSCCLMNSASPRDIVGLQIEDVEQLDDYRVILDEKPLGTVTLNIDEGCIYAKTRPCNVAEFVW